MSAHDQDNIKTVLIGLPVSEHQYKEKISQELLVGTQEANVDNALFVGNIPERDAMIADTWYVIMSIVSMAIFDVYSLSNTTRTISHHSLYFENNIYDTTTSAVGCLMEDYSMDLIANAHKSNIAALQEGGLLYTGISDVIEGIVESVAWSLFNEIITAIHGQMYSCVILPKYEIADVRIEPRQNMIILCVEVYNNAP